MVASFLFYSNKKKQTNIWICQDCSYMFKFKIIFHQRRFLVMWITIFTCHILMSIKEYGTKNTDFILPRTHGIHLLSGTESLYCFSEPYKKKRNRAKWWHYANTLTMENGYAKIFWVSGYHTETSHSPLVHLVVTYFPCFPYSCMMVSAWVSW